VRLRLGAVAAVLAAAALAAWLHARGHEGSTPVPWKDVSREAHIANRSLAAYSVTKQGDRERIFISPGPRSSTGYAVKVERVVEQRRQISLEVREIAPRLGQRVQARVTYPYVWVEIPRTRKHVSLTWLGH
jgi:hypothetical protein